MSSELLDDMRPIVDTQSIESLALRLVQSLNIRNSSDFFAAKEFFELTVAAAPIDGSLPRNNEDLVGFRLAQTALFYLRSHRKNLTHDGILWRGRPDFMTDELLASMQEEFGDRRSAAIHDRWGQYLGEAGPVTLQILQSDELRCLVESYVGELSPSRKASCIFYDEEGAYIRPHVDTDNYCVNANLLIDHTYCDDQRSSLVVYPVSGDPRVLALQPGELVLFYADCIIHSRTPISKNERVWVASFGFQVMGEFHQ